MDNDTTADRDGGALFPHDPQWLVSTAPPLLPGPDATIGLIEAVAWVGTRSRRASDAVRWHLYMRDHGRDFLQGHWLATWCGLGELLESEYDTFASLEAARLIDAAALGEIVGYGRFGDSEDRLTIEPRHWINVKVAFEHLDSIAPDDAPPNLFGKPRWHDIQFLRSDVERLWPAPQRPQAKASVTARSPVRPWKAWPVRQSGMEG
jgi:hypothetical protein